MSDFIWKRFLLSNFAVNKQIIQNKWKIEIRNQIQKTVRFIAIY